MGLESTIFVPGNPIELAQELQWDTDMAHPELAVELANQARQLIGDPDTIYGSKPLIIHSLSGFILNRGLTVDEQIYQHQFDEITLKGYFSGIKFIQKLSMPKIQTFAADMFDVRIISPSVDDNPSGRISPPVLLPVLDIQSVMVAT